jgi:FAD:protein FMN transferase
MSSSTDWVVVEQTRRIMATRMSIHIAVAPGEVAHANATIARVMAWLESLSDRLTRFAAGSELAQLNASSGTWCAVSGTLFTVVAESIAAARATGGLFDPALLPLLEAIGYDRDYDEIEHRETGQATGEASDVPFVAGRWRDIELDARRLRVLLPPGTRLDLGGIAKGWAADAALARFFASFENVLINAGGDMRARGGAKPGEPWALAIGNPFAIANQAAPENAAVLTMRHGGIATSGATGRWWYRNGERQHHLLDPRTGHSVPLWIDESDSTRDPSRLIATATALAPSAAHAEVAAKAALLRGYPQALHQVEHAWEDRYDAGPVRYGDESVALLLILGDGNVVCSANIHEFLADVGGGGDLWLD